MRITADRSDTLHSEVERLDLEARFLQEGHDEAAQAAVHVQASFVLLGKSPERDDVVLIPVWEIDCRPNNLNKLQQSGMVCLFS